VVALKQGDHILFYRRHKRGKEMSRESIEELRARLLRDPEIQTMIKMRAYEIYQLRGGEPGYQAEDWFRAEGEVLEFLIEEESRRTAETTDTEDQTSNSTTSESSTSARSAVSASAHNSIEQPPQPPAKAVESGGSQSPLSVWSVTEPDSTTLAPPVGNATEFQIDAPKKSRASSKSSSPRKTKADESGAGNVGKKTASRASLKKPADSSTKAKSNRKKSSEAVGEKSE
jgi:hypothetical protein